MMKNIVLPLVLLLVAGYAPGNTSSHFSDQNESRERATVSGNSIHDFNSILTADKLREHLFVIASDSFQGRMTGTPGIEMAAEYIVEYYKKHGIQPMGDDGTYFQNFHLQGSVNKGITTSLLTVTGTDTSVVYSSSFSKGSLGSFYPEFGGDVSVTAPVVFVGYGINDPARGVSHLGEMDVRGKWVMMFSDIRYVSGRDTLVSTNIMAGQRLSELLFRRGAAGIIMVSHMSEADFTEGGSVAQELFGAPSRMSLEYTNPRGGFRASVLSVSPALAASMLGLDKNGLDLEKYYESIAANPSSFTPKALDILLRTEADIQNTRVPVRNIVSVVEGSDPELKNEYVVLSAHYDHVGIGAPDATGDRIHNGADDNGSGTVAVMTIARAMNEAKLAGHGPRRSVIFLHVTAEEIGLLGSRYYSDHPTVPVEQIVANLNIDMIGRIDEEHEAAGETDYVYIIGAEIISSDLNTSLQAANKKNGNEVRLDNKYNDLQDPNQFYRRSDHWNFGRLGIPFAFFFTGVHVDYHRPGDTPDKIYYDKYSKITRLVYSTAAEIANAKERPVVDSQEFINITQAQPR